VTPAPPCGNGRASVCGWPAAGPAGISGSKGKIHGPERCGVRPAPPGWRPRSDINRPVSARPDRLRRWHKAAYTHYPHIGLRNLDLVMGCERRVVYDFVNVIQGDCTLKQALIRDKRIDSLHILAASQTRDKAALSPEGAKRVLDELIAEGFDYILCDSPAGIERGAHLAMHYADRAIVVVNPEVS